MAGERLATLVIIADRCSPGSQVGIWFGGVGYKYFTAVNQTAENQAQPLPAGSYFVLNTPANDFLVTEDAKGLARVINATIAGLGLPYTARVGPAEDPYLQPFGVKNVLTVQATSYDQNLDFNFPTQILNPPPAQLGEWQRLTTIKPVHVTSTVTPAGIFGSATGAITLAANTTPGFNGFYYYRWADDATVPGSQGVIGPVTRTGLVAGTYTCVVTEPPSTNTGASTTVSVVVPEDPRLDVLVNRTDNNVALVVSGGVAPYACLWQDGATAATRQNLVAGTYTCTVTDAHGATRAVAVVIDPYRFYWSQNPIPLALDAGDAYRFDPATKPNLSFVCEVWLEEDYLSGEFRRIGPPQEQPADRGGRTTFDVQALLDPYLSEHLPTLNQVGVRRADSQFRRFYLKYAEKFGAPAALGPLGAQQQHYVVLGGLDHYEAAAPTWFSSYQGGAKPFLTWEPNDKAVLPEQPEYLYYLVDSFALASFSLQARLHLADGTSAALLVATVDNARRFEVYCFGAGYYQLGFDPEDFSRLPVVGWELWVADAAGVPQTETRRYVLNPDYVARPRFFLYTNSLGGVSTFATSGQAKRVLEVKAEQADRALGVGYDPLGGDTLTLDRTGTPVLSVSSGPLRRAQLIALQDFYLSRRVVLQSAGRYWPGTVKAKTLPVADESLGDLPDVEFDFVLPKQRQFSARLDPAAFYHVAGRASGGEGAQP